MIIEDLAPMYTRTYLLPNENEGGISVAEVKKQLQVPQPSEILSEI